MTALPSLIGILQPVLYALAWANYGQLFFRDDPHSRRTVTPLLWTAWGFHVLGVNLKALTLGRCPMGNLPEVLSLLVAAVVLVYLILEHRQKNKYTGFFVLSLSVPLLLLSAALPAPEQPVSPLLRSPYFGVHTTLALLGYSAFGVCAIYGVMFLLLHRSLKRQAFGLIFHRLPSLEGLAGMTMGAAVIGFCALGLTIAVGTVWGSRAVSTALLPHSIWEDPKIYLTTFVWLLYGVGILARVLLKWSSRPTVVWFLAAFVVTILAAVALNTILPTFHDFSA